MLLVVEVDKVDEVDEVDKVEEKAKMVDVADNYATNQEDQSSEGPFK